MSKSLKNKSGMILLISTMIIIVMSIIAANMASRSFSSASLLEAEIKRLAAEQVIKSAFWKAYQQLQIGAVPVNYAQYEGEVLYSVSYTVTAGVGPGGEDEIVVTVTY